MFASIELTFYTLGDFEFGDLTFGDFPFGDLATEFLLSSCETDIVACYF